MKFLILNGSPHKGNTWKIAEAVKAHILGKDPSAEFNEIHMMRENLPFCCGCSNCFRIGHEKCPHSATVMKIIQAIEEADGVIVASTTYNMRETSLLKNLFDHLCFMLHRPHFFRSKALVITTTGGVGAKPAAKSIVAFLKGIGFNRCYRFSAATSSWNAFIISERMQAKIAGAADKFYRDVSGGRLYSPSAILLIPYNLFRGMSLHYVKGTEFETVDGAYWTEECRSSGVYDRAAYVPFYKRPLGHLFYMLGKIVGKKMIVTYKK